MEVGSVVAVDESMTNCQSKCEYTVLFKSKPIPKGIKFYMANDSFTGYCFSFLMHNQIKGVTSPQFFTCNIVVDTVNAIVDCPSGMTVVADNYYGSLRLATKLIDIDVKLVATIRSNRTEVPESIAEINVANYTFQVVDILLHLPYKCKQFENGIKLYQCNDINTFQMICSHPDLTLDNELTMLHNANVSTRQRQKYGIDDCEIEKRMSTVARFYNLFMGGTDRFDQLLSSYNFRRRCARWTVAVHYYALNSAATNAFIIYKLRMKEINLPAMSHKAFVESLAKQLLNYESPNHTNVRNHLLRERDTKLNQPLNDTIPDWLPYLLKKTEKLSSNQQPPLITQPVHLSENRFHYPALIKTPLAIIDSRVNHAWRPKCIKSGCWTSTKFWTMPLLKGSCTLYKINKLV